MALLKLKRTIALGIGSILAFGMIIGSEISPRANGAPVAIASGAPLESIKLTGLIRLPGQELVVLEVESRPQSPQQLILRAAESQNHVEVIRINAEEGSADLALGAPPSGRHGKVNANAQISFSPDGKQLVRLVNTNVTVRFQNDTNRLENGQRGLIFENIEFKAVLDLYSRFANRTLLCPSALSRVRLTLNTVVEDEQGAAVVIEKALLANGITSVADGNKFLIVIPTSYAEKFKPRSSEITTTDNPNSQSTAAAGINQMLPAGAINFVNVSADDAALIYAALIGRKLESNSLRAYPMITLRTHTLLSREEAIYALDTVFAVNGIRMEQVGTDLVRLAPLSAGNR